MFDSNQDKLGELTCEEGETPRDSGEGERDFDKASAGSAESLLPACELGAGSLSFRLSLMVPGKERPLRKLQPRWELRF